MTEKADSLKLFFIFMILAGLYVVSMFYRVSNAVIAPNLIRELNLNAESLGYLGGAFFYSFALLQIPMGPMLDRFNPRIIVTLFPLLGALGALIFSFGQTLTVSLGGRVLIGIGMASILVGSMKIFTLKFSPDKFATLVGSIMSIGTLGSIMAATPLAYLAATIGWRRTFVFAGIITALFAFSIFIALGRDRETPKTCLPQGSPGLIQSARILLRTFSFWQIGAIVFFGYGTFVSLQGLWLGPYLMEIKGYSPIQTGNMLTLIAIGMTVGGPFGGYLSDRMAHFRKWVTFFGFSFYCLSLLPLVGILNITNPLAHSLTFFLMGFFYGVGMTVYSHAKERFPANLSGTVFSWVTFFAMAGGAVFMPLLGKVIQSFPKIGHTYPVESYHLSFLICFLSMLISLIFYTFSLKTK
jgi:MFS family permease